LAFGSTKTQEAYTVLIIALAVEDPQDREEQIDDVQIETDGSGNLLFDMVLAKDQLGVHENIAREYERGKATVYQLASAAVGQEGGHEAEEQEAPERAKEIRHPRCEVILGLACE